MHKTIDFLKNFKKTFSPLRNTTQGIRKEKEYNI